MTDYFGTIASLQDPFNKNNIEGVSIVMYRSAFTRKLFSMLK